MLPPAVTTPHPIHFLCHETRHAVDWRTSKEQPSLLREILSRALQLGLSLSSICNIYTQTVFTRIIENIYFSIIFKNTAWKCCQFTRVALISLKMCPTGQNCHQAKNNGYTIHCPRVHGCSKLLTSFHPNILGRRNILDGPGI